MSVDFTKAACPLPLRGQETVQLAHGSGGRMSGELIERLFVEAFANPILNRLEDHALLSLPAGRVAISTDTFVVDPLFFPGGNIGELAINGTVNDVAMSGGKPLHLTVGFVLEEGFALAELARIVAAMAASCRQAGVTIVTGDTKVVNRGCCDKIFINTTGVGVVPEGVELGADNLRPGDLILLSGPIAEHGMAIMTSRAGLSFQSRIASDTAALHGLIASLLAAVPRGTVRALRDPTRGGVAASLNEWSKVAGVGIRIREEAIPVRPEVRAACDLLGIDPLYVANEGKLLAAVAPEGAEAVLAAMRRHPLGLGATLIGAVEAVGAGRVAITTLLGAQRLLAMPHGEQLPRIC